MIEPEIIELRGEIKRLHNSIHRLTSLIKIEEPHREKKEVSKHEEEEEHEKRDEDGDQKKVRKGGK